MQGPGVTQHRAENPEFDSSLDGVVLFDPHVVDEETYLPFEVHVVLVEGVRVQRQCALRRRLNLFQVLLHLLLMLQLQLLLMLLMLMEMMLMMMRMMMKQMEMMIGVTIGIGIDHAGGSARRDAAKARGTAPTASAARGPTCRTGKQ